MREQEIARSEEEVMRSAHRRDPKDGRAARVAARNSLKVEFTSRSRGSRRAPGADEDRGRHSIRAIQSNVSFSTQM
jgi:hypothetical protein